MEDKRATAALLDVRLAMAQVFERERVERWTQFLFTHDPFATVERSDSFVFVYPGAVYGVDTDRGVVWENPDVPGVDARRFFDLHGRDLEAERDRLRGIFDRRRPA
jgi:hypothetical protein